MTTETKLWHKMGAALEPYGIVGTRMEVSTAIGVADVEYVSRKQNGWIENKVARFPRTVRDPVRFGHELTVPQCTWLLGHDNNRFLRSFVCIGFVQGERFSLILLLEAIHAIQIRKGLSASNMIARSCAQWRSVESRHWASIARKLGGRSYEQ